MACAAMGTRTRRNHRGFTLIEIIVALAVLSVASWIIVGLFTASITLGARARHERLAAEIAEQALTSLAQQPQFFQWGEAGMPRTELFPVTLANDPETLRIPAALPATLPAERAAATRNRADYERFTWEAHGRLPNDNAAFYEVIVAVRWQDSGRDRVFTLTRTVGRHNVENLS